MRYIACLLLLVLAACSPVRPRGDFALIAAEPLPVNMQRLGAERVTATQCFPDNRVDVFSDEPIVREAMDAALAKAPGATALADMRIEDDTGCVTVSGYPEKVEQFSQ
jgi:hypothetical protein